MKVDLTEFKDAIVKEVLSAIKGLPLPINKQEEEAITYLSINEASEYLGVTKPTLRKFLKHGKVPVYKLGTRSVLIKQEIDQAIQKSKSEQNL